MSQTYKSDSEHYASGTPRWGSCIRGCQPSYLDCDGFCSPACHMGAPRGEFVTLPKDKLSLADKKFSEADTDTALRILMRPR